MPPSIDVLTSSSAPAWPRLLMALNIPLPSPNVMVPKQSLETRRPVLPSVAYSMAFAFLVSPKFPWRKGVGRWHGLAESIVDLVGCVWKLKGAPSPPRGIAMPRAPFEGGLFCIRIKASPIFFYRCSLLPVADQHVAARGRKLWTIFLEATQNRKIALIHQLATETLHVAGACLLLLIRAATSQGATRNRDRQQDERHEKSVHYVHSFRP